MEEDMAHRKAIYELLKEGLRSHVKKGLSM